MLRMRYFSLSGLSIMFFEATPWMEGSESRWNRCCVESRGKKKVKVPSAKVLVCSNSPEGKRERERREHEHQQHNAPSLLVPRRRRRHSRCTPAMYPSRLPDGTVRQETQKRYTTAGAWLYLLLPIVCGPVSR